DRARFAQIGKHRPLVLALLDRATELRQRYHRHLQLLGKRLEAAADLGDFVDSVVLTAPATLQELQVVYHDESDVVPTLEPSGAGAQRGDSQRWRIVDIKRQLGESLAGVRELLKVLATDLAHAQRFARNARLLGENASRELVTRHLEAEESDPCADRLLYAVALIAQPPIGAIEGNVGGERGLPHAGPAGKNDQVGIMQAAALVVDRGKPCRLS